MSWYIVNKYSKTYFRLIERAKARSINLNEYYEKHHVFPSSLGGDNTKANKVMLTAREHYLAHLLLTKMTEGKAKRSMSFALSFFNTACKNHTRDKPKSHWYEYSRKLVSLAMIGTKPSAKCRAAVSAAKKGIPISAEQSRKLSDALTKYVSFFAVSPTNEHHSGEDVRGFCKQNKLSYFTIQGKFYTTPFIITAGKNKGWIFSKSVIENPDQLRKSAVDQAKSNRSKAIVKQWTSEKKKSVREKSVTPVTLSNPHGIIHKFDALSNVRVLGPVSTIQRARIGTSMKYGAWAGWTRLV